MNILYISMSDEVYDLFRFATLHHKITMTHLMKEVLNTYKLKNITSTKLKDNYSRKISIKFKNNDELNYYKESARNINNDDLKIISNYLISPVSY